MLKCVFNLPFLFFVSFFFCMCARTYVCLGFPCIFFCVCAASRVHLRTLLAPFLPTNGRTTVRSRVVDVKINAAVMVMMQTGRRRIN